MYNEQVSCNDRTVTKTFGKPGLIVAHRTCTCTCIQSAAAITFEILYQSVPVKRRAPLHLVDTPDNATLHSFIHVHCYVHVYVQYVHVAVSDGHASTKEHRSPPLTFNQTLAIQCRIRNELWNMNFELYPLVFMTTAVELGPALQDEVSVFIKVQIIGAS